MDKIEIKGLEVFAHHGVYEEEQRLGQKFVVSAVLSLDTTAAAQTDDLDKTVNYGAISRQITQILQRENHKLLERAAAVTSEEILLTNPLINGITIKIEKPWAPIGLPLKTAAVCIERGWKLWQSRQQESGILHILRLAQILEKRKTILMLPLKN